MDQLGSTTNQAIVRTSIAGKPTRSQGTAEKGRPSAKHQPLDNVLHVTTPECISFQYELVGPFRRLFAYLADILFSIIGYGVLVFALSLLGAFIVAPLFEMMGLSALIDEVGGILNGFISIGFFVVYWFYGAYCEAYFNGATLGKSMLKMRVISVQGHGIDASQAILRNLFRFIDVMPFVTFTSLLELDQVVPTGPPTFFFGLIVMMLNRRYQRLGDLVAGTVVVSEDRGKLPTIQSFDDARVPMLAELIPESFFVPPSMARTIADYVEHRPKLNYQRASEIASYLAIPLLERFKMPADTNHDLLLCAMYYKLYSQQEVSESTFSGLAGTTGLSTRATAVEPASVADLDELAVPTASTAQPMASPGISSGSAGPDSPNPNLGDR